MLVRLSGVSYQVAALKIDRALRLPEPAEMPALYRPDIDGMRAFAVIFVLVFHAFPNWLPGGFVGVDVFFVISGFPIRQIILSDIDRGSFSPAAFYARRVRRIF